MYTYIDMIMYMIRLYIYDYLIIYIYIILCEDMVFVFMVAGYPMFASSTFNMCGMFYFRLEEDLQHSEKHGSRQPHRIILDHFNHFNLFS